MFCYLCQEFALLALIKKQLQKYEITFNQVITAHACGWMRIGILRQGQ